MADCSIGFIPLAESFGNEISVPTDVSKATSQIINSKISNEAEPSYYSGRFCDKSVGRSGCRINLLLLNLLNDLKQIEYHLFQQSSLSLITVCNSLCIDNPLLVFLTDDIKCENYMAICVLFIQLRTQLMQKLILNDEENSITRKTLVELLEQKSLEDEQKEAADQEDYTKDNDNLLIIIESDELQQQ
ncbi:unnamed protein product [Didymodactylos carnosus]|uniref:Uncharacterized protein n=1 Tax=Didymodactylos carnosus TaxID=1234261 RepID=A0A8S2IRW0_9BILA|nr:unnamed protein product [Didymodactylos carnosus]CAF3772101.1 unnamed protein product [Didymodactylos carnosus]